uniref:Uncharacterized protein n=1 Tax=Triticum urartu TaxID=4572 RepID=A0A8R7R6D6_TRIUA
MFMMHSNNFLKSSTTLLFSLSGPEHTCISFEPPFLVPSILHHTSAFKSTVLRPTVSNDKHDCSGITLISSCIACSLCFFGKVSISRTP